MRWLALAWLAACPGASDVAPGDTDDTDETDVEDTEPDLPRCGGFDEPCAAIVRPTTQTCGATLDLSDPSVRPWPERLSDVGCFVDGDPARPGPDLVPYDIVAPLWTQGSTKDRWVVLPPGATIEVHADGQWLFPPGAVIVKRFDHDVVDGGVAARRTVEVRLMARAADAWSFASYRWDPTLGDGVLEGAHGEMVDVTLRVDGADVVVPWWFPGLDGCSACHRAQAEEALGPRTAQLDRDLVYGGLVANQLVAWWSAGMLDRRPDADGAWTKLVDPYGDAPVAERARSWLHGNCAHCHLPDGFVSPDIHLDLRRTTPEAEMQACGVPVSGSTELDATVVIAPGDADASQLVQRLQSLGPSKMPPDGAVLADEPGLAVVRAWIDAMVDCPAP